MSGKSENIKVVVRCRPLDPVKEAKYKPIVDIDSSEGIVYLKKPDSDQNPKNFSFNSAYPYDSTQQFVYDDCARPIVDAVLEGFNGTIFAYGQSGTGKTHTMEGDLTSPEKHGIILHSFDHIFAHISGIKDTTFLVHASFLQIYMEEVYDLLGDVTKKLHVRQLDKNQISVVDLSKHIVKSPEECQALLSKGHANRKTAKTNLNRQSSRSHSVFTIVVEQQTEGRVRLGKLHLVDLAGSERLAKTGAEGERMQEGIKINQSLLALGNVISGLVTGAKHIAYRDSKLTQMLQDSLGGNSKTCMVATVGPASYNYEETFSTLMYATRARDIKNAPKINEDPKDALLGQLKAQIDALKRQLESQLGANTSNTSDDRLKDIELAHKKQLDELIASKTMNEEQKAAMKAAYEQEYARQKNAQEESAALEIRIKQMEQSVLVGGVNLVDKAKQQEEELRAQQSAVRRKQQEQKKLAELAKAEETQKILAEKQYSSIKEEAIEKRKKIVKIAPLIQQQEENIEDMQKQFELDRQKIISNIQNANKDLLKLKTIAQEFIPKEYLSLIEATAQYDEVTQHYIIPMLEIAGCHQKKEEIMENVIMLEGDKGPISLNMGIQEIMESERKRQEELQKKRVAEAHKMLAEFAIV